MYSLLRNASLGALLWTQAPARAPAMRSHAYECPCRTLKTASVSAASSASAIVKAGVR
jgi:hypothetical protein